MSRDGPQKRIQLLRRALVLLKHVRILHGPGGLVGWRHGRGLAVDVRRGVQEHSGAWLQVSMR